MFFFLPPAAWRGTDGDDDVGLAGDSSEDEALKGMAPTPKHRKKAKKLGLRRALSSGLYPTFKGPTESTCTVESSSFDFLKLAMCERRFGYS